MSKGSVYQPEIDGLRAIAVLSVLLFHADFPLFNGGYIGVDVFFVISGFLITRIIRNDMNQKRFSFSAFYLRRARRLFPALITTIIVTYIFAIILLLPTHLVDFSKSLVASLLWCSNFFFWTEAGYFDSSAYVKPLLHTWSLSVEEQFYLFWPGMLVICMSTVCMRNRELWFVIALSALSFTIGIYQIETDPYAAFYMPFSRIAEFGIGAMLVWLVDSRPQQNILHEVMLPLGLSMIAAAVFLFDKNTAFPGFPSLLPCIGAAICIYSGHAKYTGVILRNRLAVSIGLISYSLYLVHWPVIVFIKYQVLEYSPTLRVISVILCFALALIMYRLIEVPFRRPTIDTALSPRNYLLACASLVLALSLSSAALVMSNGWDARWDLPAPILNAALDIETRRIDSFKYVDDLQINDPSHFDMISSIKIVIIGDSHSKDLFNAVYLNRESLQDFNFRRIKLDEHCFGLYGGIDSSLSKSQEKECLTSISALAGSKVLEEADWILVAPRWTRGSINNLPIFVRRLKEQYAAKIAIVGRTAEFEDVPKLFKLKGNLDKAEIYLAENRVKNIDQLNNRLESITVSLNLIYLDKANVICGPEYKQCDALDNNGNLIYFDYGHWTLEGAKYLGQKMIAADFFQPVKEH